MGTARQGKKEEEEKKKTHHGYGRKSTFFDTICAEGSMLKFPFFGFLLFGGPLGIRPEMR